RMRRWRQSSRLRAAPIPWSAERAAPTGCAPWRPSRRGCAPARPPPHRTVRRALLRVPLGAATRSSRWDRNRQEGSSQVSERIVISGLGAVTPLGTTAAQTWAGLTEGRSGVGRISSFDPAGLPTQIAAEVRGFDPEAVLTVKQINRMSRASQLATVAAREAGADAGLPRELSPGGWPGGQGCDRTAAGRAGAQHQPAVRPLLTGEYARLRNRDRPRYPWTGECQCAGVRQRRIRARGGTPATAGRGRRCGL